MQVALHRGQGSPAAEGHQLIQGDALGSQLAGAGVACGVHRQRFILTAADRLLGLLEQALKLPVAVWEHFVAPDGRHVDLDRFHRSPCQRHRSRAVGLGFGERDLAGVQIHVFTTQLLNLSPAGTGFQQEDQAIGGCGVADADQVLAHAIAFSIRDHAVFGVPQFDLLWKLRCCIDVATQLGIRKHRPQC